MAKRLFNWPEERPGDWRLVTTTVRRVQYQNAKGSAREKVGGGEGTTGKGDGKGRVGGRKKIIYNEFNILNCGLD